MRHLPLSLQVLRLGVESGGYCLGEGGTEEDEEGNLTVNLDFYDR